MPVLTINGALTGINASRVKASPPEPQTVSVQIDGRNGALDLTDAMMPWPRFKNRTVTINATMWDATPDAAFAQLLATLHGRRATVRVGASTRHWDGRWTITSHNHRGPQIGITLIGDVHPYQLDDSPTQVTKAASTAGTAFSLTSTNFDVYPTVTVTGATVTLTIGSKQLQLGPGTYNSLEDVVILPGAALTGTVKGATTSSVKFTWTGGAL